MVLPLATLAGASLPARAATPGLMVRSDGQPQNLDPHQIFDVPMMGYALNTYDGLYRYQNNPPVLEPWLATGHTASEDGLDWEFKLRPRIVFHDGSPLTSPDVVYSFRRVLALGKAPASAFLPILKPDHVTAPDPLTVRFRLDRPYGPFLAAIPIVAIVNARLGRPTRRPATKPPPGWPATRQAPAPTPSCPAR